MSSSSPAEVPFTLDDSSDNKASGPLPESDHADGNDRDNVDETSTTIDPLSVQSPQNRPTPLETADPVRRQRRKGFLSNIWMAGDWLRPLYLGVGLFFVLFPFWLLDSLKDPLLSSLTLDGLERHQPTAKLFSVCTTLFLVCLLEYIEHGKSQTQSNTTTSTATTQNKDDILDEGGMWNRMHQGSSTSTSSSILSTNNNNNNSQQHQKQRGVDATIFVSIGVPYCIAFGGMAYLLQFYPLSDPTRRNHFDYWHVLGYVMYAAIESYGSLSVAAFWSYTNSTLSLNQAEGFYGPIIFLAQFGALGGSTLVTVDVYDHVTLVVLACLIIILHICVMYLYAQRFAPTHTPLVVVPQRRYEHRHEQILTWKGRQSSRDAQIPWLSGIYTILQDNYVLLILGASCLYEVSLTCLHYQMTLLGSRNTQLQQQQQQASNTSIWGNKDRDDRAFARFMGKYGQMVNISSLVLSSIVFPFLMRRVGLRLTLRLFPTFLLLVNIIAFVAMPGNLHVLVISLSLLKGLSYSIHDPSTEILYLPTAPAVKFQAKFWIDVVGARIAKAFGSSINAFAGSVDRSIRVAMAPSIITAVALVWVCFRVGNQFNARLEQPAQRITASEHDDDQMEQSRGLLDGNDDDDDDERTQEVIFQDPLSPNSTAEFSHSSSERPESETV